MKSFFVKLGIGFSYLIIAFIGFEIRSFIPIDPFPHSWSAKVTEFIVTHSPFDNPFSPPQICPDYKDVVRIMGKTWPNHSYGQAEFYGFDPRHPDAQVEPVIERGISYRSRGVVKWRYKENEPYIAFELAGNWTDYFDNENGKGIGVQQISDSIPRFKKLMESNGFIFSEQNNIPLYRYPEGAFARKIGFTKGNYLYHFTIVEDDPPYDPAIPKGSHPKDFQKPIHIAMSCAENLPELRVMYEQYLSKPHNFTNETSIVYGGRKDSLVKFTLYYPGGVLDQTEYELYDARNNSIQLINKINNFTRCSTVEVLGIGKDSPCYKPEEREFGVVSY